MISQKRCWAEFCRSVNTDLWGLPYRIVAKKLDRRSHGMEAKGREQVIANYLFPTLPAINWFCVPLTTGSADSDCPPRFFSLYELWQAARLLFSCKATGPDGMPNEVLSTWLVVTSRSYLTYKTYLWFNIAFPRSGRRPD